MLRRWTLLACLLLVGSYPSSVFSLGLGEAVLHSALYEPLNADIQILSADRDALENLDVRLASDAAFSRAGIDRAFYLTDFRFDVEDRTDGSAQIRVTSTDPIREPFVDFVMEVQWPGGRMQRRYTLLLDPRSTSSPSVQVPSIQAARPARAERQLAAASLRRPSPAVSPLRIAGTYGPVQANETLWSIASNLRPNRSVSVYQMMMALLQANPDAFIGGDVNLLMKGSVLKVPQFGEVQEIGAGRAVSDVKPPTGAPAAGAPAAAPSAEEAMRLRLVSPGLSTGAEGAEGGAEESAQELKTQLSLAREELDSVRQENEQLRGKVAELEGMVDSMKRLLEVKDQELAQLQAAFAELQGQGLSAEASEAEQEPVPQEAGPVEVMAANEAEQVPVPQEPAEVQAAEAKSPPPSVQVSEDEGFSPTRAAATLWNQASQSPAMLASLGAAVLLLGSLTLWAVRSRRRAAMASRRGARQEVDTDWRGAEEMALTGVAAAGTGAVAESLREEVPSTAGEQEEWGQRETESEQEGAAVGDIDFDKLFGAGLEAEGAPPTSDELQEVSGEQQVTPAAEGPGSEELSWDLGETEVPAEQAEAPIPEIELGLEEAEEVAAEGEAPHGEPTEPTLDLSAVEPAGEEAEPRVSVEAPELDWDLGQPEAPESKPEEDLSDLTLETTEGEEQQVAAATDAADLEPPADVNVTGEVVLEEDEKALAEAAARAVENRLDLAKAYLELGDTEDARVLLEEIKEEGDEAARQEAEDLLSRIA